MSYQRISLVLCAVLVTDVLAETDATNIVAQPIEQPKPQYPASERERSREGWVVLNYTISDEGLILDPRIEDSSGSDAFNKAALKAVRDWRFESAEEQKSNVLLSFVNERRQLSLSREFFTRNAKVHRLIDNGELDAAQERIAAIRKNNNLSAFELAYSFITEGRVAGERGDKVEQLRCFRRAMLNQGRWLKRENYLKLLYATVVLEMQQQDFASALRDYELLTETQTGRKVAVDLEEPIQAVRAIVESNDNIPPPYMVANMEMSIEHEVRAYSGYDDTRVQQDSGGSYPSESSTSERSTN